MLLAVAHRPMARDSKTIFVRKSFLSLNVILVPSLAFGMKLPLLFHADAESDSLLASTLCSTVISVSIPISGLVGHSQKVSSSESSVLAFFFYMCLSGGPNIHHLC